MKLTSLFHLSLITLAAGLTADLTAAAATVQPKDQSSASASAQATSGETATESNKNAHTDSNAQASLPQEALTSGATGQDSPHKPKVAVKDHAPLDQANPVIQAALQQNTQSSSASAQADAKEARAKQNTSESEPQQPLTLTFKLSDGSINQLTFNKKESFSVLANLLKTNIEELRKCAAQSQREVTPKVYEAIRIVSITEDHQTTEEVEDFVVKDVNISLEGAMAWYAAYMQAVANGEITLCEHANLNGAVGACAVKLLQKNIINTANWRGDGTTLLIRIDRIVKFLLQETQLTSVKITTEYGTCDAAQYMYMIAAWPWEFCSYYKSLNNLQDTYPLYIHKDYRKSSDDDNALVKAYDSLLSKKILLRASFSNKTAEEFSTEKARAEACKIIEKRKRQWAEESEKEKQAQAQSATAVEQQPKIAPASTPKPAPVAAESDHHQANPAPIMDAPAQPKNMFTRTKDFFHAHRWAKYTTIALAGAAAIYGGYRLYKHVNMGKLARYAGNWA